MIPAEDFAAAASAFATSVFVSVYTQRARNSHSGKRRSAGSSSSVSTKHGKKGVKPTPDYLKIARLEIELFGMTQICDGSPVPPGFDNAYGIDKTGHFNGACNVNSQLGPVCNTKLHRWKTRMPPSYYKNSNPISATIKAALGDTKLTYRPPPNEDPYADWTDEDGRPW